MNTSGYTGMLYLDEHWCLYNIIMPYQMHHPLNHFME